MIRLDVITGFLGSGKTTLIKQLIREGYFEGEQVVILENDYGEVNIDAATLSSSGVPVYEITKGCICCSLQGDFIETLCAIYEDIAPDRVLIEPSGIFMIETLQELMKDPRLSKIFYLNSVTAILDGSLIKGSFLPMEGFIGGQLKFADRILISKIPDFEEDSSDPRHVFIRKYNHESPIDLWSVDQTMSELPKLFTNARIISEVQSIHRQHPHDVASITIEIDRKLSQEDFDNLITAVQSGMHGDIIRMKGVLNIDGIRQNCQYASGNCMVEPTAMTIGSTLTIIGTGLQSSALLQALK